MLSRSIALMLIVIPALASAQSNMDAVVSKAAKAYLAEPQTMGLSIGVVHQGQQHHFHYGVLSKDRAGAPGNSTVYPIASVTKTFAGALMAQAAADGKLKLDDDVRVYLDGDYANLAFNGQPIRLAQLLNHRSGLPNSIDHINRAEFYAGLKAVRLSALPGTRFQYSNAAAQLAGFVLERVQGRSFEALLKETIAKPLGMDDTTITLTQAQKDRLAPGYDEHGKQQAVMPDTFQAAGAIKSTLPDMLKYAQWQMEERDAVVKLAHQPTYTDDNYAAGLNWQMLTVGTRRVIWQDGAVPGYAVFCILQPEAKLALVILSNQLGPTTLGRLSAMANDIMKGIDPNSVTKP